MNYIINSNQIPLTTTPTTPTTPTTHINSNNDLTPYGFGANGIKKNQSPNLKDLTEKICFIAKLIFFPLIPLVYIPKKIVTSLATKAGITGSNLNEPKNRNLDAIVELSSLKGRNCCFKTEDGFELEATFFNSPDKTNPQPKTILVCSGSHRSSEFYNLPIVKSFLDMGHNVMTFNYRGFGESQGEASEKGLYKDGEAAYQYLVNETQSPKDIVVYGYSLGGGVASDIAARHQVDVILDRTFSSGADRAAMGVNKIISWVFRLAAYTGCAFNNKEKIKHIKGNIFIAQEKGAEQFLEKMQQAFKKCTPNKENLDRMKSYQLTAGHFHNTDIDEDSLVEESTDPLWFSKNNTSEKIAKKGLEAFLSK